ncbi:hypothetical protein IV203_013482 [Nitzschia inconspicua]|uniref:Uncharacterized protein n=1 Tax=Nitzschia inconspicua TaxID=303405 RepID=A0A9K3M5E3_9STRA|nr:hypothetical protein IV203_013482 [Nitzschia inconspicua]
MSGDPTAPDGSAALNDDGDDKQSKEKTQDGSAVVVSWPTTSLDLVPHLAPLRDNHSSYTAVAKTCFILNQYASHGSCATVEDTTCVDTSAVFHDVTMVEKVTEGLSALMDCMGQHDDRRAKILACKTAALVGRATYARLRHTPLLFSIREAIQHRLEDEVGTDVPAALMTVALEDPDEGVAASAMSSLGILVLSTTCTPGTLVEDELLSEILCMVGSGPSLYAPSLRDLVDEDANVPQTELQSRILDNIMMPRLLQLVSRFQSFEQSSNVAMVLPTLTASVVYLSKVAPPMLYPLDKAAYSKRWVVLDYVGLIESIVEGFIFPLMKSGASGGMGAAHIAALSAIRLAHACPSSWWVREVLEWAVVILKDEIESMGGLELQLTNLAALVIASRALPLPYRAANVLEFVVKCLQELPATAMVPHGIVSAGLLLEIGNSINGNSFFQYRKPTRPAFWAELALSFFMDGPVEAEPSNSAPKGGSNRIRSQSLLKFLRSTKIMTIMKESGNGNLREEMVMTFCQVAFQVGRRHKCPEEGDGPHLICRQEEIEEWLHMSVILLKAFGPCLVWGSSPPYMEEEMTMLVACQVAYTRLFQEVLHGAGLLNPSSVSLKMTSVSSPPNILWDQMEEAADFLVRYDAMPVVVSILEPIEKVVDDIVKREMNGSGIVSHHMRLFLLSLVADHWVLARVVAAEKTKVTGVTDLNVDSAKQILIAISPRRMFNKVVESNKALVEGYSKSKKDRYKKHAQDLVTVCVACIENMALIVCDYVKRFGNGNEAKVILNSSVVSLQGKSWGDSEAPVLPVCQSAIERVQSAFQSGNRSKREMTSTLIPSDFKRRPIISSARMTQGRDAFNEGYLMQLTRQIVNARSDRCIFSFPTVYTFPASTRKQNWLRLSLSPLPKSRNQQISTERLPRFDWGSNVISCAAGSDPAAVTLAHSITRSLRFDGAEEFRLMITMRIHNLAAAEIPNGLRLELGISEENVKTSEDAQDGVSVEVMKSLVEGFEDSVRDGMYGSTAAVYGNELKGGDHVTWEVIMNPLSMTGAISLKPSVMYRAMEKEPPHATWVTASDAKKEDEDTSVTSGLSQKSGGSKADSEGASENDNPSVEQNDNIVIPCQQMLLSPMVGLQPCPFVFFRDGHGDIDSFRFLWTRMPCQLTPLKLMAVPENEELPRVSYDSLRLSALSTLAFQGDPIPGGIITRLWAFISPQGKRAMFVLAEQESDNSTTLHARGDDKQLLLCLAGTGSSRNALISALQPGMKLFHHKILV